MSGSLWTHFRKTESNEDRGIDEKQRIIQEVTPVDVGPGGLSFEEGAFVRHFAAFLRLGSMTVA